MSFDDCPQSWCRVRLTHQINLYRIPMDAVYIPPFVLLCDILVPYGWCVGRTLLLFVHYSLYFMDQVLAYFSDFIGAKGACVRFETRKGFVEKGN